MKTIKIFLIAFATVVVHFVNANNLRITNVSINQAAGTVTFDINWDNSWRQVGGESPKSAAIDFVRPDVVPPPEGVYENVWVAARPQHNDVPSRYDIRARRASAGGWRAHQEAEEEEKAGGGHREDEPM